MKFACLVYIDNQIAGRLSPEEQAKLTNTTIEHDWSLSGANPGSPLPVRERRSAFLHRKPQNVSSGRDE